MTCTLNDLTDFIEWLEAEGIIDNGAMCTALENVGVEIIDVPIFGTAARFNNDEGGITTCYHPKLVKNANAGPP